MKLQVRVCTDATQERGSCVNGGVAAAVAGPVSHAEGSQDGRSSLLVRLLDSDLGLDCDMAFSIGGAICLALEQVG